MADVTLGYFERMDGSREPVRVKRGDRRYHTLVTGKTGTGKSTLLENMIVQNIRNGEGLAVIDPHGTLIDNLLKRIPKERMKDVVYVNPADTAYPVGFNLLETTNEHHLIVSSVVSIFKHLYKDSWGPRLEMILANSISAVLVGPHPTLLGVYRMLVDDVYRKQITKRLTDPVLRSFWDEFETYDRRFKNEVVSPVLNKIGQLLMTSLLRNIVGQSKSTINIRDIMESRKILLVRVSKGELGEEKSNLLGSAILTKIFLSALEREKVAEGKRPDFYLYVDEFHNYLTDVFASILSEARKYRLNLILAHQYLDQVSDVVRPALFGNVGTMIVFRVGATDAEVFEKEFAPHNSFTAEELKKQKNFEFSYKTLEKGVEQEPSFAKTFSPLLMSGDEVKPETIIKVSRQKYGKPKSSIELKLSRFLKGNQPVIY